MKALLWIYAVVGTSYFWMYSTDHEVVTRYAVGPLWLLMMGAPVVLSLLILLPVAERLGLFGKQ